MIKKLINYTLLSILIFFSISFLTIFNDIYSPLNTTPVYPTLSLGFPFTYYEQFQVNNSPFLNAGWNLKNLLADCFLTWSSVVLTAFLIKKYFKK